MRVAQQLHVARHDLDRRHRGPVRHRPHRRVQDRHAEIDRIEIGFRGLAEQVVRVELDRLAARLRDDRGQQGLQALLLEHAGRVVEQDRVDVRADGQLVGLVGVVLVGVDRRQREHDRARDLGAELLRDLREPVHLVDVEQHVVDPEAAAAVHVEPAHPRVHQGVRRDAEGHRGVRAHTGADLRARHRLHQQIEACPRVLAAVLDETLEHRRAGEIDHAVAGAIDDRGDRQCMAGLHAHAPQALLPVAHRLVEEFDMCHGGLTPAARRKPAARSSRASACSNGCARSPDAAR